MSNILPGSLFKGRYRVDHVLRSGPNVSVVAARDEQSQRDVMLKVLHWDEPEGYSARVRARYQRELGVLGALRDPHTIRFFLYDETEHGELFLVFERVSGETLRDMLQKRGRFSEADVRLLLGQILSSLREAHHHGVLHRDLRPDAIWVDWRNGLMHAIVGDFGVARPTDEGHPSVTATGELVGTPRYMSPEQLLREPISASSDLYAVGLIGIELLHGGAVLGDGSMGASLRRLDVPPMSEVPRGSGLDGALTALTQREPSARPATADAAAALLRPTAPSLSRPMTVGDVVGSVPGAQMRATPGPVNHSGAVPVARPQGRTDAGQGASNSNGMLVGIAVLLLAAVGLAGYLGFSMTSAEEPKASPVVRRTSNALVRGQTPEKVEVEPEPVAEPEQPKLAAEDRPGAIRSAGCSAADEPSKFPVIVYVPQDYDPRVAYPTVILLHGDYLSPQELLNESGFIDIADEQGLILIVPDDFSMGSSDVPVPGAKTWIGADDPGKVRNALKWVEESYCVDRSRAFLVSHGAGAWTAAQLACEPWVTAYVTNGYAPDLKQTLCDRKVARMALYPLDSPHVKIGKNNCINSPTIPTARHQTPKQMADRWRKLNVCKGEKKTKREVAKCRVFECDVPVEICEVPGGTLWPPGHVEFLGHAMIGCAGDSEPKIDVTAAIWDFLKNVEPLPSVE